MAEITLEVQDRNDGGRVSRASCGPGAEFRPSSTAGIATRQNHLDARRLGADSQERARRPLHLPAEDVRHRQQRHAMIKDMQMDPIRAR